MVSVADSRASSATQLERLAFGGPLGLKTQRPTNWGNLPLRTYGPERRDTSLGSPHLCNYIVSQFISFVKQFLSKQKEARKSIAK
jgi:hypothetical protein